MRNRFLRSGPFLLLPFLLVCIARSQRPAQTYAGLLRSYRDAQFYYDKATNLSYAKNYGPRQEALEKQWNQKALDGFIKVYSLTPPALPLYDSLRFQTLFKIGELYHYFEKFSEAIGYYKEAIRLREKTTPTDSILFRPYLYAGMIYYKQNKFDTAIQFFGKAEKVQMTYTTKLAEGERLFNLLGVLYYERGNYKQAQNYFQKALSLLPLTHPYYNELFVNYKINLAQLHMRLEEYDKAAEIYRELLPRKVNLNEIYHNIGSLNLATGSAANALTYFRKVRYQNNKTIRLYNSIGSAFFHLSVYDSAMTYFQKAVGAYRSLGANADAVGYGLVLKSLGDYQQQFKNFNEALSYYQKAIHQFYPAFTSERNADNPTTFSGAFSYINLFTALIAKAGAWHALYLQNNDRDAAGEELVVYQAAFGLIDYVERTYESDEARLFLTKTIHELQDKPINVAYQLYQETGDKKYLSLLYGFDQQNKATVLALNRQLNTALAANTSPAVQKERQVKDEITRLSIKATQLNDSTQLASLNNSIRDYEIELGKAQENLYASEAIHDSEIPSLQFLQSSLLDAKTALVSYHLSAERLTTFIITKRSINCYQQILPKGFSDAAAKEIVSLKSPSIKPATAQNVSLYDLLLSRVPLTAIEQLIIIPDDVLAYLPFESLQNKDGKFLIQQTSVQYQFSAALLQKMKPIFPVRKRFRLLLLRIGLLPTICPPCPLRKEK